MTAFHDGRVCEGEWSSFYPLRDDFLKTWAVVGRVTSSVPEDSAFDLAWFIPVVARVERKRTVMTAIAVLEDLLDRRPAVTFAGLVAVREGIRLTATGQAELGHDSDLLGASR